MINKKSPKKYQYNHELYAGEYELVGLDSDIARPLKQALQKKLNEKKGHGKGPKDLIIDSKDEIQKSLQEAHVGGKGKIQKLGNSEVIVENSDDESESISFNLEENSKDSEESVKSNEHFARVQGNEINFNIQ